MHSDLWATIILMLYYLFGLLAIPTMFKVWTKIPTEVIRKTQHIVYSLSIFLLLEFFTTWYAAVVAAFILVIVAFPILLLIEGTSWYRRLFVDRTKSGGELRKQLLYVQLSFAALISIFWGVFGGTWNYIIATAVMVWGFGDAAAALVGIFFGQKKIEHPKVEGAKTYEGTGAMIVVAFGAIFLTLTLYGKLPWTLAFLLALVTAPVAGLVELFSRRGTDTLTVPLATVTVLFPLIILFFYLGW